MMAIIARIGRALWVSRRKFNSVDRVPWFNGRTEWKESRCTCDAPAGGGRAVKIWVGAVAGVLGSCGAIFYRLNESSVNAMEWIVSLPRYPWSFNGVLASFDHATLRRGWTVYRNVCRTCHSLNTVRFLDLVDVTHTMEEVKSIAAEFEVEDEPDDEGNNQTRPAKLIDFVPPPYPNKQAAKAANFGAYPPDLTFAVLSVKNGLDYMFSLLTGWRDPPAGLRMDDGKYFNVYFPGGITTMPQMLFDGTIDYDDGTPATESQMAKDVTEFLMWTASPEHDTRKILMIKCTGVTLILIAAFLHWNRRNWSHLRSRRLAYVPNTLTGEARRPGSLFGESADKRSKRSSALSNR